MRYVIVPEGLSIDSKQMPIPSFVYRKLIDYLALIIKKNDEIYFAPANNFGLGISEQKAGKQYLEGFYKKNNNNIFFVDLLQSEYFDTLGNAIYLKKQFPKLFSKKIDLVSTYIHSKRAYYCFKSVGYNINKLHIVKYDIVKEKIVKRLWFYQYRWIHKIYEKLAYIRDYFLISIRTYRK